MNGDIDGAIVFEDNYFPIPSARRQVAFFHPKAFMRRVGKTNQMESRDRHLDVGCLCGINAADIIRCVDLLRGEESCVTASPKQTLQLIYYRMKRKVVRKRRR